MSKTVVPCLSSESTESRLQVDFNPSEDDFTDVSHYSQV